MVCSQTLSLALLVFGPQHPLLSGVELAQAAPVSPTAAAAEESGPPSEAAEKPPANEAEASPDATAAPEEAPEGVGSTEPKEAPAPEGVAGEGSAEAGGAAAGSGEAALDGGGVQAGAEGSVPAGNGDVSTAETPEASETGEASEAEEKPEAPAINPRPQGEDELLGKHPIDPSKGTYKPGTGAILASEDGKFSMGIRARVQIRDELEFATETVDDGSGGMVDQATASNIFGLRRARLQLKGHVFGEHNKYKLEVALSPRDLGYENGTLAHTPLLSYYVEFDYLRDLSVRLGQYKLYYSRQRVISSGDLELVDRTEAQGEFNLDRDVGFHFFSKDVGGLGFLKYYAGISVGEGRDPWISEDFNATRRAGAQYLARVEVLPFGDFKDYSEVDFERLNKFRLSIGAAYAFLDNGLKNRGYQGKTFADGGRVDYHNMNADLFFKWAGMTGLVEFYLRDGQRDSTVADGDMANLPRNGIGGTVQVGYLIPKLPIGLAARYSGTGPASFDLNQTALREGHEAGGGLSWYIAGHPLKLQADYFHSWGEAIGPAGADRLRVQLQLAY